MAVKTNCERGKYKYFRISATIGKTADGKPIRKDFMGKSQKEAIAKRDAYLAELNKGLAIEYDKMKLGELMNVWLFDYVKVRSAPNTLARYVNVYNNYIKPTELNSKRLCEVKFLYLQKYYNKLFAEGKRTTQIFNLNKVLRTFFNFCITNSYMLVNPTYKIVIPKDDSNSNLTGVDIFTDEEINQITQSAKGYSYILFRLALATGLREGELLGLELGAVDLEANELIVRQALKFITVYTDADTSTKQTITGETKNKKTRTVPIPQSLISEIKTHINCQKALFFKNGLIYNDTDFLFTTEGCQPINARNWQRAWERLLKRAGVRHRKFHNVRHTYASKLFAAGVDLKTVSTLLGHSNIGITADTYTHVIPKLKTDAADKIDYLFASTGK